MDQAEEEEGREASHDLRRASGAETRAVAHSQAGSLVRAATHRRTLGNNEKQREKGKSKCRKTTDISTLGVKEIHL